MHTQVRSSDLCETRASGSPIAKRILTELHALNLNFLQLLAADATCDSKRFAPDGVFKSLAQTSADALQSAAQCPFSLFDASFGDSVHWQRYCDSTANTVGTSSDHYGGFATTILFFAWHLVNAGDPSTLTLARLCLGMHAETAISLRQMSLSHLMAIAGEIGATIRPRWSNDGRFWPELIGSAVEHDTHRLHTVRMFGRQLLAAEAIGDLSVKSRHH